VKRRVMYKTIIWATDASGGKVNVGG